MQLSHMKLSTDDCVKLQKVLAKGSDWRVALILNNIFTVGRKTVGYMVIKKAKTK